MPIQLLNEDVLSVDASALLLTIDGQAKGLGGIVASAFIRNWPDAYNHCESQLEFPIPLGRAIQTTEHADSPWPSVIFLTTLNHLQILTDSEKIDVMAMAFIGALNIAVSGGMRSVSSVVLKGGWRLPQQAAFLRMVDTFQQSVFGRQGRMLNICCLNRFEYEALVGLSWTG